MRFRLARECVPREDTGRERQIGSDSIRAAHRPADLGENAREIAPHADVLRTLPREQKRQLARFDAAADEDSLFAATRNLSCINEAGCPFQQRRYVILHLDDDDNAERLYR